MAEISEQLIETIQEAVKPVTIEVDGKPYLSHNVFLPPPEVMPIHWRERTEDRLQGCAAAAALYL